MIKNQHYVPRWYLKYFADEKGRVCVYDKAENRYFKTNISNICSESYFHAVGKSSAGKQMSQVIEFLLSVTETAHSSNVTTFLELVQGSEKIKPEDKMVVTDLFSHLFVRNKAFREEYCETYEKVLEQVEKFSGKTAAKKCVPSDAEYIKVLLTNLLRFDIISMSQDGYSLTDIKSAAKDNRIPNKYRKNNIHNIWKKGLLEKPMKVITVVDVVDTNHTFITADNPAIEQHPPFKDILGNALFDRTHLLALNHKTLVVSLPRNDSIKEKVKRKNLFDSDESLAEILFYNASIFHKATRFVFGKTEKQLSSVKYIAKNL